MVIAVRRNSSVELMNDWYRAIVAHDLVEAIRIKEIISKSYKCTDEGEAVFLYYTLLKYRHDLLNQETVSYLEMDSDVLQNQLKYYFYFFQAIHLTRNGKYREAREHFLLAGELLEHLIDDIGKADYHYKVADFYYNTFQPTLSIKHALKSKDLFETFDGYELKIAGVENILGLDYILLGSFEDSQHHFEKALGIIVEFGESRLESMVHSNLGLLYSDQGQSDLAIEHFQKTYNEQPENYKNIFLLANELSKINQENHALDLIQKGLSIVSEIINEEYIHHFNILSGKIMKSETNYENVVVEGIAFFVNECLYDYVEEYSTDLANFFYNIGNNEKASYYFKIASESKNKLKLKEGIL